jgi:serine O-acetyltransferase
LNQTEFGIALVRPISHAADTLEQQRALFAPIRQRPSTAPLLNDMAWRDLQPISSRAPAFVTPLEAFLFSKGFQALQAHRISHWLYLRDERLLAKFSQARCNVRLAKGINPASRLGSGIMLDHATGIVIGETVEVGDDVSILQGVTLGGAGKESGDRHPRFAVACSSARARRLLAISRLARGQRLLPAASC